MKTNKKMHSIALASAALILFLIFVSSTASASIERDLHKVPPDITIGAGDPSDDKVLSDELSIEGKNIVTAALNFTEKRITNDEPSQWYPVIYDDRIVWMDDRNENWDIYMYNLSTSKETRITTNGSNEWIPDIYGNRIVWEDWRNDDSNSNSDIYMYDLLTSKETPLITGESAQRTPAIYGDKIVWCDCHHDDYQYQSYDIYMYDLLTSTETRITTSEEAYHPDIYGNIIVWEDYRNGNADIYMFDLSTSKETQITTDESDQYTPAIYGNKIVWEDRRNDNGDSAWINSDIYMYDLSTKKETQVTTNPSTSYYPAIYGNRIVWVDDRNGNWDIYVYDIATGQESHTTDTSAQYCPDIYGDRIVWEDHRDLIDIYMGTLSNSPVAAFSAFPTSGKAPLTVVFTDKSTGTPTKWKWTFGDGKTSTQQNPKHQYLQEGNYTVKLTVTNASGSSVKTKTNYIKVTTNTRPGLYSKNK